MRTAYRAPLAPTELLVSGATATSVELQWLQSVSTGGLPLVECVVRVTPQFDDDVLLKSVAVAPRAVVDGLRPGKPYVFEVCATNELGPGAFSEPTPVTRAGRNAGQRVLC